MQANAVDFSGFRSIPRWNGPQAPNQPGYSQRMATDEKRSVRTVAAPDNLTRARRHAEATERVASFVAVLGAFACLVLVMIAVELMGVAVSLLVSTLFVWCILRAVALLLHLKVDEALERAARR